MYVGVILHGFGKQLEQSCIPHVCGGDPNMALVLDLNK